MEDKQGLISALTSTRDRILGLVQSLEEEQLSVPYHPGVNPPLWELGHSMFFYEVFILSALDGTPSYDPAMDELWDSFHMSHGERWSRTLFPDRNDTLAYARAVYRQLLERLEREPLTDQALYLYRYGIYHQNMHIESMIWCRQTVGYPRPDFTESGAPVGSPLEAGADVTIPGGDYRIGYPEQPRDLARQDFAFDNEKPGCTVTLAQFNISRTLVSNAEFLQFVQDGGYQRPELWSQGGRQWLARERDNAFGTGAAPQVATPAQPFHWRWIEGHWQERLFNEWLPLAPAHPVRQIAYWEAEAYCQWAGRRLPTEFEWEAAALGNRPGSPFQRFPWGDTMDAHRVDMDGRAMGRVPVTAYAPGDSASGCRQMIGTVWEWTSSQFLPYDGFAMDMYPYMSVLQFGDHKVSRGGSCATTASLIRGTYRQAYFPDRTDVFTGFRTCAR
ncbi:MAG: ergothioneine biosynthesis protein EgtB [Halomonadaceae bacterium]|nr:MAG: ergothioneine biosynthesis protein EgtB [Halomonadaceae bacterium]